MRASNSRKHKIVEKMIRAEVNPWSVLFNLSYFIPLSQLENALYQGVASKVGATHIKTEVVRLSYNNERTSNA